MGVGAAPRTSARLCVPGTTLVNGGATIAPDERHATLAVWEDRAFGCELHYGSGASQSAGFATALFGRAGDPVALRLGAYPGEASGQSALAELMTLTSDGRLGVGVPAPTARLQVAGAVRVGGYAKAALPSAADQGGGAIVFVPDEAGGATLAFSDGAVWRRVQDRAVVS